MANFILWVSYDSTFPDISATEEQGEKASDENERKPWTWKDDEVESQEPMGVR